MSGYCLQFFHCHDTWPLALLVSLDEGQWQCRAMMIWGKPNAPSYCQTAGTENRKRSELFVSKLQEWGKLCLMNSSNTHTWMQSCFWFVACSLWRQKTFFGFQVRSFVIFKTMTFLKVESSNLNIIIFEYLEITLLKLLKWNCITMRRQGFYYSIVRLFLSVHVVIFFKQNQMKIK